MFYNFFSRKIIIFPVLWRNCQPHEKFDILVNFELGTFHHDPYLSCMWPKAWRRDCRIRRQQDQGHHEGSWYIRYHQNPFRSFEDRIDQCCEIFFHISKARGDWLAVYLLSKTNKFLSNVSTYLALTRSIFSVYPTSNIEWDRGSVAQPKSLYSPERLTRFALKMNLNL